ncbi:TPA: hypothetical protein ACKRTE_001158 [Providencia rettgeri]
MVIGEEDAILYDPAGSYTGCMNNECALGLHTLRGSGDFLEYPILTGTTTFLNIAEMAMIS